MTTSSTEYWSHLVECLPGVKKKDRAPAIAMLKVYASHSLLWIYFVVTLLLAGCVSVAEPLLSPAGVGSAYAAAFEEIWGVIDQGYYDPEHGGVDWAAVYHEYTPRVATVASDEDFYRLMQEMVDRLDDEHTYLMTPEEARAQAAIMTRSSSYVGVGFLGTGVEEGILILALVPHGPADQAGLQVYERIVAVDGIPYTDAEALAPGGLRQLISGEAGTDVTLTLISPPDQEREVTVTRQTITTSHLPIVQSRRLAGSNIVLLAIHTFMVEGLADDVATELESQAEHGPIEGLIIDLRTNDGGLVLEMLKTLSLLVDGGSIGSVRGRSEEDPLYLYPSQTLPAVDNAPLAVLIDYMSNSSAEMFASGVQILGRGIVVGRPSRGNTENVFPYEFPDGGVLWLAERVYQQPDGTLIEGIGVQPDVLVDADWWRIVPDEDPIVLAAVEALLGAR
jgi:carboxyl-terminal processing protease